jgi:hypothetical protein
MIGALLKEDRDATAVAMQASISQRASTRGGSFEEIEPPFGLCGAPSSYGA